MNTSALSARLAVLLASLVVILFSLTIILGAYEDPAVVADDKAGPGAFSTSAIGYAGLYELLQRVGWQVERGDVAHNAISEDLLVLAEPTGPIDHFADERLDELPDRILLVLPKWKGVRNPQRAKWISDAEPVPIAAVRKILAGLDREAAPIRQPWPSSWQTNVVGISPSPPTPGTAQLLQSGDLRPLVACETGILLGETRQNGKRVWILSDPDIMANHGIAQGDNAAFMLALFAYMDEDREEDAAILFDEAVHGYRQGHAAPLRLLFRFPFVVVTILAFLSGLLLVWAGAQRFGQPVRAAEDDGFGKAGLIDNSARLMEYSGHQNHVLRRYISMSIHSAAEALHAPPDLDDDSLAAWLDDIGRIRGMRIRCGDILQRMRSLRNKTDEPGGLLQCAGEIHDWQTHLLSAGPRAARPHTGGGHDRNNRIHAMKRTEPE